MTCPLTSRSLTSLLIFTLGAPAARAQETLPDVPAHARDVAEPAGGDDCPPEQIARAALSVFVPAPPEARRQSARLLGRCGGEQAAGLLGAALAREPDPPQRRELIDALAKVGGPVAQHYVREALDGDPAVEVRQRAVELLVASADIAPVERALMNPRAPDPLRASAARALIEAGRAPAPGLRAHLARTAGPQLSQVLKPTTPAATPAQLAPAPAVAAPTQLAPAPVEPPRGPADGTALAVASSMAAGGLWGGSLAMLGEQKQVGVVTLVGAAGAVIGGGTAWGLTRFGYRPTVPQALWYTNSTAWGSLAGLALWSGSGSDSTKLKYGLLVGGETLGIVGGVWSARRWPWTAQQVLLADSLVLGTGLASLGIDRMIRPDAPVGISAAAGYGAAPAMVLAAVAARHLQPSAADTTFMLAGAGAASWTAGLISGGLLNERLRGPVHEGGLLAGLGVGYLAGVGVSPWLEVDPRRTLIASAGLAAGNLFGLGLHMLADPDDEQRWSIGAGAGGLAFATAAFAAQPWFDPGPRALSMTGTGALYGSGVWLMALRAGYAGQTPDARAPGGALALGVAGGTAGLIASRWFAPDGVDQATAFGTTALGISAGLGTAQLLTDERGDADFLGVAVGAATGLAGGALFTHHARLRPPQVLAGGLGAAQGAFIGALVPSLTSPYFEQDRSNAGGTALGLAVGAVGGTALARLTDASAGEVMVPGFAGWLGAGFGYGVGQMFSSTGDTKRGRIGAVGGAGAFMLGAGLAERYLHLSSRLDAGALPLGLGGGALGAFQGSLLADLLDTDSNFVGHQQRRDGTVLAGAMAGLTTGLLASPFVDPGAVDYAAVGAGSGLGWLFGQGLSIARHDDGAGRTGPALRLAGSMVGMAGTAFAAHHTRLRGTDLGAATLGSGYGVLIGSLLPDLHRRNASDDDRLAAGAALGTAIGGFGAAAASNLTGASGRGVMLASLGATDGLLMGLGIGTLIDDDGSSQARRIGVVAGSAGGLLTGAALWPRLRLTSEDRLLVMSATALGAWNGGWAATLGEQDRGWGGLLAGAGASSFLATALVPALDVDRDLVINALAMDALISGAGAGIGALASQEDEATTIGMLAGGAVGLLTGGALHDRIDLGQQDTGLLLLSAAQGSWFGAWLPHLLWESDEIDDRRQVAAFAAGAFGATSLALIASPFVDIDANTTTTAALGSAIGASVAGGAALLSEDLSRRASVGLTLGGTAVGLAAGAFAPRLRLDSGAIGAAALGASIGAAEGLAFAWAGRASGPSSFQGAALVGAGLGATLGLAASAAPEDRSSHGFAAAGFAAWGGWIGSFAGALAKRDAHEVTLGGLLGAHAGLAAGELMLRTELVQPRDFGWLSLFGAAGTVLAGGVGAALSSSENPRPALAGLAIGPLVGMTAGAFFLPRVRTLGTTSSGSTPPPQIAAPGETPAFTISDRPVGQAGWRDLVEVVAWTPIVGALPEQPGAEKKGPPALMLGVAGLLR